MNELRVYSDHTIEGQGWGEEEGGGSGVIYWGEEGGGGKQT